MISSKEAYVAGGQPSWPNNLSPSSLL